MYDQARGPGARPAYTASRPYNPPRQPVFLRNASRPNNPQQATSRQTAAPGENGLIGDVGYDNQ
jgi:hypothetical protein